MHIVGDADLVRPEVMPWQRSHRCKRRSHRTWRTWRVRVLWVTDDPQKAVLCDRARSEAPFANAGEPIVSLIVLHVGWVDERDQDVDVEQECRHGCSSRS